MTNEEAHQRQFSTFVYQFQEILPSSRSTSCILFIVQTSARVFVFVSIGFRVADFIKSHLPPRPRQVACYPLFAAVSILDPLLHFMLTPSRRENSFRFWLQLEVDL